MTALLPPPAAALHSPGLGWQAASTTGCALQGSQEASMLLLTPCLCALLEG